VSSGRQLSRNHCAHNGHCCHSPRGGSLYLLLHTQHDVSSVDVHTLCADGADLFGVFLASSFLFLFTFLLFLSVSFSVSFSNMRAAERFLLAGILSNCSLYGVVVRSAACHATPLSRDTLQDGADSRWSFVLRHDYSGQYKIRHYSEGKFPVLLDMMKHTQCRIVIMLPITVFRMICRQEQVRLRIQSLQLSLCHTIHLEKSIKQSISPAKTHC